MTVADVSAVAQAFHDAFANQDPAAFADLYHDDARFLPPNAPPCEGRSAIETAIQAMFDMGARSVDIEPIEVRECGELTVEYGRYTLGIEPDGGEPMTDVGKYLVVHDARDDGSTKILYDCFNSNSPPPA